MTDAGGAPTAAHLVPVRVWRRRPTMQSVLLASLVTTAGVWMFTGYYFVQRVRALEREAEGVTERYAAAEMLLSEVRRDVDRAAISLREALIDTSPGLEHYRDDVDDALEAALKRLQGYQPVLGGDTERQHLDRLRGNINALRLAYHDFLAMDAGQWGTGDSVKRLEAVRPRRDATVRVSGDLQRLNRDAYLAHQAETTRLHTVIHSRTWQTVVFGALAGLVIGLGATFRVGRLERELRARQERDAATAAELQELSTRLVDAQEEERQRIARELHDGVGQVLTALKLELGQVERRTPDALPLAEARTLADSALTTVRDVSHLLHPPELEQLGLVDAIGAYVETIRRRQTIAIEFVPGGIGRRLDRAVELAVYRIVQEAVTNVLRHARARHCRVALEHAGGALVLTVGDDGVGFDRTQPAGAPKPGLGLTGIRERVQLAGGTLRVDTAPGRGTVVRAEFPWPEDAPEAAVPDVPTLAPVHSS